jgi:hypothetical protein
MATSMVKGNTMAQARIYINRTEIQDALEAYDKYLNEDQKNKLKNEAGESDFWLFIDYSKKEAKLYIIEDEG